VRAMPIQILLRSRSQRSQSYDALALGQTEKMVELDHGCSFPYRAAVAALGSGHKAVVHRPNLTALPWWLHALAARGPNSLTVIRTSRRIPIEGE